MKKLFQKKWQKHNFIVICIGLILLSCLSIGYAVLMQFHTIVGIATIKAYEDIRIINIESLETACGHDIYIPKYTDNGITINGQLPSLECELKYTVRVINNGTEAMELVEINDEVYSNKDIVYSFDEVIIGKIFSPSTTTEFTITFKYNPSLSNLPIDNDIGAILEFIWHVRVIDNESPIITMINSDNYTIFSGTDIDLKSLVIVSDNVDADIESKLVVNSLPSDFSNTNGGLYTITYNAKDSSGNIANEVTIKIYVIEFIKIAAGRYHTLALTVDGYVYAWGLNDIWQLGDNTTSNRSNPIKMLNISNIVDIAAGYSSSYLVTSDGKVYAWGYGIYGQLGHGNTNNYQTPTIISNLTDKKIISIDAGYHTVIALSEERKVYTWGYNGYRQIGDNTVTARYTPYETSLSNIKRVAVGYWHTLAASDTEVYVWGSNGEGQLGTLGSTIIGTPTKLSFNHNIKQISAGGRHSFILTNDGSIYVFGYNNYGQAGVGSTSTVTTPRLITTISNIEQIDAGYAHSIALTSEGKVYVWGYNTYAKLGIGNITNQTNPVLNSNLESIRYVVTQYETSFFLNSVGGIIYGAGYNAYGTLGNGTTLNSDSTTWKSVPSKVIFTTY